MVVKADEKIRLSFELVQPREADSSDFDGYKELAATLFEHTVMDWVNPHWMPQKTAWDFVPLHWHILAFVWSSRFDLFASCLSQHLDIEFVRRLFIERLRNTKTYQRRVERRNPTKEEK